MKKSTRIELNEEEIMTLELLKNFFDKGSRNAVLRHLIKLAREKYLTEDIDIRLHLNGDMAQGKNYTKKKFDELFENFKKRDIQRATAKLIEICSYSDLGPKEKEELKLAYNQFQEYLTKEQIEFLRRNRHKFEK